MVRRWKRHVGARSVPALVVALALAVSGCTWIGRESVDSTGNEAHGTTDQVAVSSDGRFVAFASDASDLVNEDRNARRDVFVRDNSNGAVTRVSVATGGAESDGDSSHPSISDDGRYVAFESDATNLAADDANGGFDVFVHDRTTQATGLASPVSGAAATSTAAALPAPSAEPKPAVPAGTADAGPTVARPAADGTVRVIVRARTPVVSSASLTPAATQKQQAKLAAARQDVEQAVEANGGDVIRSIDGQPFVAARVPASRVDDLRDDPQVSQVAPDYVVRPTDVPSNALIGSPIANAGGFDGHGVAVAILDTGVDSTHPFLAGRIVAEGCFTSFGTCPNGQNSQTGSGSGGPCTFGGCTHGTHVAGIAAGRRLTDGTYDGVAPGASIITVQIFSQDPNCQCLGAYSSDIVAGLEYVRSLRNTFAIAAVNMSLGGDPLPDACDTDPVKTPVDELRAVGIATVIASGNGASGEGISSPGCISTAVSVGAVDDADIIAPFSNSDTNLALLAPGVDVESSLPGGGFGALSGTSMATPHVTGVWALLKQKQPSISVTDALAKLRTTGRALRDPRNDVVVPRVCAAAALGLGVCPAPELPVPPANDRFADAVALVGSSGSIAGTNVGATLEPGEPDHFGSPRSASVWYRYTATVDGALSTDTFGSSFDTVLAVYRGDTIGSLVALAGNDDANFTLQSATGPVHLQAGTTYRIAVASYATVTGPLVVNWKFQPSVGDSTSAAISADGRYVAFASDAPLLVPGDTNHTSDVFVRDLFAHTTARVSVAGNGTAGNGPSTHPAISGDATRVAFASAATNLVAGDANASSDVFVRSRVDATSLRKVSAASNGTGANGASDHPALDRTGANAAYESSASNVVAGDLNQSSDVFVFRFSTGTSQRVSVGDDGGEANGISTGPSLSGDGRYVVFTSSATKLIVGDQNLSDDVFVRDRTDGTTRRESSAQDDTESFGHSSAAAITRDGSYVVFASDASRLVGNDMNGAIDVFLRRRQNMTVSSVTPTSAPRGAAKTLVIRGSGFLPSTQVSIPNVVVTGVTVNSPTQVTATIQVPGDVTVGNRNVVVQVPGASWNLSAGANAICVNCLAIS